MSDQRVRDLDKLHRQAQVRLGELADALRYADLSLDHLLQVDPPVSDVVATIARAYLQICRDTLLAQRQAEQDAAQAVVAAWETYVSEKA